MSLLSKPWFIAILALFLMLGTQLAALKFVFWHELFPEEKTAAVIVKAEEPEPMQWGFASDYITQLEDELRSRIAALDVREEELAAYETRLASDKAEIEEIKEQVEKMRDTLLEGIVKLEESETENLKRLAKTYSTLTPDATVSIFRELDDSTVVKILFFMKADMVGSILQEMASTGVAEQVRRAAKISDMLRLFTDNSTPNATQG